MQMPQYAATIRHLKEGVKGFTISAAVKNIEGWEEALSKVEISGAKSLARDLERLKKLLQADEVDNEAVRDLCGKLGEATVKLAEKDDSDAADKAKEMGQALASLARARN
jgi:hypothetical protein